MLTVRRHRDPEVIHEFLVFGEAAIGWTSKMGLWTGEWLIKQVTPDVIRGKIRLDS
jgi:hypothetical protein